MQFFRALGLVVSLALTAFIITVVGPVAADSGVATATRADQAFAKYGATGSGVIVAIMDRGIDYTHPDFRNPDGTTRIAYMLDMSGLNLCSSSNPPPVEYSASQINNALSSGTLLAERDAVGHGTVTTGLAAGNGRAVLPSSLQYAGMAPQADLLIVKVTSEGAPAHNSQPAEAPFQGCFNDALDWVVQKASLLNEPVVGLINSGTQWGPIDGTSAVSQKIDADFGANTPGRVYVAASGDEGNLNNHARDGYTDTTPATFSMNIASHPNPTYMQIWYTGSAPANITLTFADDGTVLTVPPAGSGSKNGVTMYQYDAGQQFYPWTSSGPDRAAWIEIIGHIGAGTVQIQATTPGSGMVDVYGDAVPNVTFTNALTPGRLTDYSATQSAIVAGASIVRTDWTDIDGVQRSITNEGLPGQLWKFSSGGPTRAGSVPPAGGMRRPVLGPPPSTSRVQRPDRVGEVDITTPGANSFAAYGLNAYWETFRFNLISGGQGYYGRHSATSAASPIAVGAVALLLQMNPSLTEAQVKQILHTTAISDANTGPTPNPDWGAGKLNVLGAADAVATLIAAVPGVSPGTLSFSPQPVGTTSAPQPVTLSNTGSATLTITSIATSGDFVVAQGGTCGPKLLANTSCSIRVAFQPTTTGTRNGTLSIKDFNPTSPQTVSLSGSGT